MSYEKNNAEIYSAGIETHGVNPRAIEIMRRDGIDISGHISNHIDEYSATDFDYVITVVIMQKRAVRISLPMR
ncbi:MAG TPA: hypothetical protein VKB19_17920 [Pedobacter sp.]|nr:hypothetical protein [Pedobacter sp.]